MTVLVSALAFLLLLTGLVLLHEFGHFLAARRAGVIVEEFGIGLPPRALTLFRQGGTRFSLNWIPFGGFVRLKGESAMSHAERSARGSFASVSIPWRCVILTGGVFMNFVLALVLLTLGFSQWQWIPTYLSCDEMMGAKSRGEIRFESEVVVGGVIPGGGAEKARVPEQSIIRSIDGNPVCFTQDVLLLQQNKEKVSYGLLVNGKSRTIDVTVADGKTGVAVEGQLKELAAPVRPIGEGLMLAMRESRVVLWQTIVGMGKLIQSITQTGKVPEGIVGIVGIAKLTHDSVQEGILSYLRLVAFLSLSLAALNILPIPALDGGRLAFVLFEGIFRRPPNRRIEMVTNMVGFACLILLIFLITYHDILSLF